MPKKKFVDSEGINRLSLIPSEYENPEIGIPVDVYDTLNEFYADKLPDSFRQRLYAMLWEMGLREPNDFLQPDAKDKYRQALRHAIAHDATDACRYILDTIQK